MTATSSVTPSPIMADFSGSAATTVIAFGSAHRDPVPPFQWRRALETVTAGKLFVRDLDQIWYQRGLRGLAASPDEAAAYLRQLIDQQQAQRVLTFGVSMGGFAALLFGRLLQAEAAYAISPQTFLPTTRRQIYSRAIRRRWWPPHWKYFHLVGDRTLDRRYFDLRPALRENRAGTQYHLHFSSDNVKDVIQAEHLAGLPGVHLHRYEGHGHSLAFDLRDSGALGELIRAAVATAP